MRILLLSLILTSCLSLGEEGQARFRDNRGRSAPQLDEAETITFEKINELIIGPSRCVKCHAGWASTEEGVLSRIVAGRPFESPFYLRMEDGSMPLGGEPIGAELLKLVEKFIIDLAEE